MKVAHWSRIAKALGTKYGLSWEKARDAYKQLKTTATRKPSLRMVSALPPKLPSALKGEKKGADRPAPKPEKTEFTLPPGFAFAPTIPKPTPRTVPTRQGTRNQFERFLKDQGLPVAAIARNETGKMISKGWRDAAAQEKLAKLLKRGYDQIARNGWMKPKTRDRIVDLMEKVWGIARSNPMWNNILKQLYGVSVKK